MVREKDFTIETSTTGVTGSPPESTTRCATELGDLFDSWPNLYGKHRRFVAHAA
jgi:hypothetical protein